MKTEKELLREKIAQDVKDFVANGGIIEQIPSGKRNHKATINPHSPNSKEFI